ncbi:MAG: response regulator [Burkholderiales bacterium]
MPAGSLAGRRVLVIDDEEEVRAGTETVLRSWGCDFVGAADADGALLAVDGRAPDAIVADWRLASGATGGDAIARIRGAFGRPIPAVIVSGAGAPDDLARIKAAGVPLLHKPVAPAKLRSTLAFLLGER